VDFSFLNYLLTPATRDGGYRSHFFRLRMKKWRRPRDRQPFLFF
jgi:hypothetical protein